MTSLSQNPLQSSPHAAEAPDVVSWLGTDIHGGLNENEARARLRAEGANELPAKKPPGWTTRFVQELLTPMSLLLILAAAVSGLLIREVVDAVVILAIVFLNAVIGVVQEGKATRALTALRALEQPSTLVVRDGRPRRIPVRELVPGDLVKLAAGDRVPADLRLLAVELCQIDESMLTGESLPIDKITAALPTETGPADRHNMAHAGTNVVRGICIGVVVATGLHTRMGLIATGLAAQSPPTPLEIELTSVTRRLGAAAIVIAGGVFAATLAIGENATVESAFLVAVALAVAAVPEGLPTVVTVGLALGVRQMARQGAIVKRLSAVETLGATTALLTDKTGTLTENRMVVDSILSASGIPVTNEHPIRRHVEEALVACTDATLDPPEGDPVDLALLRAVNGKPQEGTPPRRLAVVPFDALRRRMTVLSNGDKGLLLAVKGAPEELLPRCSDYLDEDGAMRPLPPEMIEAVAARIAMWAEQGARILAVAEKRLSDVPSNLEAEEHDLTLIALVGLHDPVRSDARDAVEQARRAGVDVVMVTGDHPGTARAIADLVGIDEGKTLTGTHLSTAGFPAQLDVPVFARVEPDQKLALVEAYQSQGHVVAVTGDGINDAPALRRADIGVAMGQRGSDVAKEAADLVIVDDDLSTIVSAVREGRGIYDNLRKVIDYLVAGNLSEILVVVAGLILAGGSMTALTPVQLLWLNLLTDGLPALALGVDNKADDVMDRPPRPRSARLLGTSRILSLTGRGAVIAAGPIGAFTVSLWILGDDGPVGRTVLFTSLVVAHLLYAFAVRPRHQPTNLRLIGAVVLSLALQVMLLVVAPMGDLFDVVALDIRHFVIILGAALIPMTGLLALRPTHSRG